jgi:hypothetical protein
VIINKAGNHPTKYYRSVENRLGRALKRAGDLDWCGRRLALQRELAKIERDITKGKLGT